jgi:hypothetical protein
MNRGVLRVRLDALNIAPSAYSLDGGHPSEVYVLDQCYGAWRVYYSERGQESGLVEFQSESDACEYLLALLTADGSTRR